MPSLDLQHFERHHDQYWGICMIAGTLEVQLMADVARLRADMTKATGIVEGSMAKISAAAGMAARTLATLGVGLSVGAIAAMVTSINRSVDAFNDLKDATGASIENISALESVARRTGGNFGTVETALIKFNMALGQTQKAGSDAEKVLNAIGLDAAKLRSMDPAQAFQLVAVALKEFADDGNKARAVQELFGKSLKEVAPLLKDLAEAGELNATVTTKQAEEAEKFNKELYKMQAALTDVGRDMANPMVTGLNLLIEKFREGKREGEGFIVTLLRQTEIARLLGLSNAGGSSPKPEGTWDAPPPNGPLPSVPMPAEVDPKVLAAAKKAAADLKKEMEEQAKLLAELSGLTGSFADDWNRLNVIFNVGKINLEQLTRAQSDLLAKQPMVIKLAQEQKKAEEDKAKRIKAAAEEELEFQKELAEGLATLAKERDRGTVAVDDYARSIDESHAQLQLEVSLLGRTEKARDIALAQYRIELDLKKQIAAIDANLGYKESERVAERAKASAAAAKAMEDAFQQAELNQSKRALAEWESVNKQIADSFVDNLMQGGKSVWQYLKDLFRTLVLRPILSPIGSVVSSIIGMMPTAANAAGSGLLGSLSSSLGLSEIGSAIAGSFGGTASLGGATMGAEAFGGVAASGFSMAGVSSALAAIPVWGWAAMGAAAIASMIGGGGETRSGGQYSGTSFAGGPSGGQINGDATTTAIGATMQGINAMLKQLGSTATLSGFLSGLESSKNGKGFAYAGGSLSTGASFGQNGLDVGQNNRRGSMSPEEAASAFGEELKQATLQALQASDVPGLLGDYLKSLGDIDALTGGALDTALARITKALTEKQTLEDRIFALTATDLEKLNKTRNDERAAIDESNLALLEEIYTLEDLATAAAAVAQATDDFAKRYTGVIAVSKQATDDWAQMTAAALAGAIPRAKAAEDAIRQQLVQSYNTTSSALQQTIDKNTQYASSLKAAREALWGAGSGLSASDQLSRARGGLSGLTAENAAGRVNDYLAAYKELSTTRIDMLRETARGASLLEREENAALGRASLAQQQIDAMRSLMDSVNALERTMSFASGLDALKAAQKQTALVTFGQQAGGETDAERFARFHLSNMELWGSSSAEQYAGEVFKTAADRELATAGGFFTGGTSTMQGNDALYQQLLGAFDAMSASLEAVVTNTSEAAYQSGRTTNALESVTYGTETFNVVTA